MSVLASDDITHDFMNELTGYLPALRENADNLMDTGSGKQPVDLSEFHRLVHTIRGAATLVGLNLLGKVAAALEDVLETVIANRSDIDAEAGKTIANTVDFFDTFAKATASGNDVDEALGASIIETLSIVHASLAKNGGLNLLSDILSSQDQSWDDGFDAKTDVFAAASLDATVDYPITGEDHTADLIADEDFEAPVATCKDGTQLIDNAMSDHRPDHDDEFQDPVDLSGQALLEGFFQEAEDHFQDLGKALGALEKQISAPTAITPEIKELIRLIRRSVHTIKGAAAVIKLNTIAAWGHEVEDVLDWLYEEADTITPDNVDVLAKATDVLERYVAEPQKIVPEQLEQLRFAFKQMIGPKQDGPSGMDPVTSAGVVAQPDDSPPPEVLQPQTAGRATSGPTRHLLPPDLGQVKTLRVDMSKIESMVNLASELTVALSAFDQDMEGLRNLIGEIDRARSRLKRTAHDLELGYEVKAIQQLGAAPALAAAGGDATAFSDFDLLELDRYSELNLIIRSLSETAVDVSTISRQLSDIYGGFDAYLNRLRMLLSELHEKTMRMRMTPMFTITNRLRRTVRETAAKLKKKVRLAIQGDHIELDKRVWEKLADPFMHLLRNAIDHGIETPDVRKAAGKPDIATVRVTAAYQGNQVVIRVTDDGAGLNYDTIRKAFAAALPESKTDAPDTDTLANLIFQPGFSTCRTISEVSGRGIGLDVVKENILGLNGSVCVEKSERNVGTTFRITLPLTMAVMKALLFDVGGHRYATALYDIKEILRLNPEKITGDKNKTVDIGGRRLPYYHLAEHLTGVVSEPLAGSGNQRPLVLIMGTESWQGAVAIDRMYGQREIVIKSLGTHLRYVKGVGGATVMGDGKVVPILNFEDLLKTGPVEQSHSGRSVRAAHTPQKPLEILVVDDSVSVRTVVARLMQRQGWQVRTAKDGVEAIERLHTGKPDLIILDVEMPRMNGYEFMSSLRAQNAFEETPVIMLTSRASAKHREKAEALGVNGFITKPYEDEEFVALVKRLSRFN